MKARQTVQEREGPTRSGRRVPSDRRSQLIEATITVLVEHGFEGLRTRRVAERAGVNVATLHYYFATKEKLIEGLADYLGERFRTLHAPGPPRARNPGLARLRQEFADGDFYWAKERRLLLVMQELIHRARRSPAIARILQRLLAEWRSDLEAMLRKGTEEGAFRPEIAPADGAALLATAMMGLLGAPQLFGVVFRALERALVKPEVWEQDEERKEDGLDRS
ncbi:TetR/AcrR family transcriptional regulator [Methylacidimicrobium sp. B4]|uniref:TetR/AcrR family transcriptional regulator n=1 Tax=Methylacidimicrobium sp. B4 TaxID=2796139 RepID=UPI001A8EE0AD|nr:TetR/AcrR family transcriptional regulator [Methylacidimicrobium sp. B4]QSR85299.1 TetR/AcrR family transcriptional regulator [Methylacidimicrobium sp. B4]